MSDVLGTILGHRGMKDAHGSSPSFRRNYWLVTQSLTSSWKVQVDLTSNKELQVRTQPLLCRPWIGAGCWSHPPCLEGWRRVPTQTPRILPQLLRGQGQPSQCCCGWTAPHPTLHPAMRFSSGVQSHSGEELQKKGRKWTKV